MLACSAMPMVVRTLLALFAFGSAMSSSVAQAEKGKPTEFSGSMGLAFPTGDFGKATGTGIGGFMHVAHSVGDALALSATFGVIHHLETNNVQLTEIPLLVGGNLYLIDERQLFAFAQLGLSSLRTSTDLGVADLSETESKLGANVGLGAKLGFGNLRLSVLAPSVPDIADGINLMVSYEIAVVQL